jgi:hypothetical protein
MKKFIAQYPEMKSLLKALYNVITPSQSQTVFANCQQALIQLPDFPALDPLLDPPLPTLSLP